MKKVKRKIRFETAVEEADRLDDQEMLKKLMTSYAVTRLLSSFAVPMMILECIGKAKEGSTGSVAVKCHRLQVRTTGELVAYAFNVQPYVEMLNLIRLTDYHRFTEIENYNANQSIKYKYNRHLIK